MEDRRRSNTVRAVVDVAMMIAVGIPSLVFATGMVTPFQRGFFCDDESIRYPLMPSTIPTAVLIVVGGGLNILFIVICEVIHYWIRKRSKFQFHAENACHLRINPCVYTICGYIWILGFGMLVTQGITDVGKFSVGRLRPHFIDGCKPSIDMRNCTVGKYITDFTCIETDPYILKDIRVSFPSGHASMSAFTMIFLALYVQARIPRFPESYLVKHVLQLIVVLMGWYTCLSRIHDYKHHWSDVLAGGIIGTIIAVLVVRYIAKSFRDPYQHGHYRTYFRQGIDRSAVTDMSLQSMESATHPLGEGSAPRNYESY